MCGGIRHGRHHVRGRQGGVGFKIMDSVKLEIMRFSITIFIGPAESA